MRPSRSRPGSLAAAVLLPLLLALAGCEAQPPTAVVAEPHDTRPTGPLSPAHEVRNEHIIFDTSIGYATVRFGGSLCGEDLRVLRAGTPLSGLLAHHLSGETVFGVTGPTGSIPPAFVSLLEPYTRLDLYRPGYADMIADNLDRLVEPYETVTNMFLLWGAGFDPPRLPSFGNAGLQVEDAVAALAAGLPVPPGTILVVEKTSGGFVGTETYSLFQGIFLHSHPAIVPVPVERPDFDAILAANPDALRGTGTVHVDLYAYEFVIRPEGVPADAPCLSARAHKQAARDLLLPHAAHPDTKVRHRIEKALERLERSLDPGLWVDDAHLEPKKGKKVFDHERKAAHEILKLLKKATDGDDGSSDDDSSDDAYDLDATTIADLEAALEMMLAADRALASNAMGEVDCAGDGKCAKELSKAGEKYERAERYAAEGRTDKAIGEFKKAWEKAIRAASRI